MENRKLKILRKLHEEYLQREAERMAKLALQSAWLTEMQHVKANHVLENGVRQSNFHSLGLLRSFAY